MKTLGETLKNCRISKVKSSTLRRTQHLRFAISVRDVETLHDLWSILMQISSKKHPDLLYDRPPLYHLFRARENGDNNPQLVFAANTRNYVTLFDRLFNKNNSQVSIYIGGEVFNGINSPKELREQIDELLVMKKLEGAISGELT